MFWRFTGTASPAPEPFAPPSPPVLSSRAPPRLYVSYLDEAASDAAALASAFSFAAFSSTDVRGRNRTSVSRMRHSMNFGNSMPCRSSDWSLGDGAYAGRVMPLAPLVPPPWSPDPTCTPCEWSVRFSAAPPPEFSGLAAPRVGGWGSPIIPPMNDFLRLLSPPVFPLPPAVPSSRSMMTRCACRHATTTRSLAKRGVSRSTSFNRRMNPSNVRMKRSDKGACSLRWRRPLRLPGDRRRVRVLPAMPRGRLRPPGPE